MTEELLSNPTGSTGDSLLAPTLKTVSIDELVPYENNARTHSKEQIDELIESIKTVGLLNPLAVAEREDGR